VEEEEHLFMANFQPSTPSLLMHLSYLVDRRERTRMMRGGGGGVEEKEHLMANSQPLTPSLLMSSPSTSFSSL